MVRHIHIPMFNLTKSHSHKPIGKLCYTNNDFIQLFTDPTDITIEVNRYVADPL